MRIGIDARLIDETGVGRYIRNLIKELAKIDKKNYFVLFLKSEAYKAFVPPNVRWKKVQADVPWHSFSEQIVMPIIFTQEKLDLLHVPYFNFPIFYPGNFIVTIHDLTIMHLNTGKASTLPLAFYAVRRAGYAVALYLGLLRAKQVICVSQATADEVTSHFPFTKSKVVVTYEAVDDRLVNPDQAAKRAIEGKYILYVGNAYPHKNVEALFKALKILGKDIKLVLVGKHDYFYNHLQSLVWSCHLDNQIKFISQATDAELSELYIHSSAFIFPSKMEGFGLPGLEAMAFSVPVVCSDIPVFKEIYGQAALYFNPDNPADIAEKVNTVLHDMSLRKELISLGQRQFQKYSWHSLALATLEAYNTVHEGGANLRQGK